MRNFQMATVLASVLAAGALRAADTNALPADVGPGHVAWFDITTTSMPLSKEFYGKLFDWRFVSCSNRGRAAAAPAA